LDRGCLANIGPHLMSSLYSTRLDNDLEPAAQQRLAIKEVYRRRQDERAQRSFPNVGQLRVIACSRIDSI